MSKFWKLVVIVALVLAGLMLITFLVPDITKYASALAGKSKLPIWLVGLAAPILYVINRLKDMLGGLIGESASERDIREKNEAIKAKLAELEKNVQGLDEWRRSEIARQMKKIDEFTTSIASMEGREKGIDKSIDELTERREQLSTAITEEPGTIE